MEKKNKPEIIRWNLSHILTKDSFEKEYLKIEKELGKVDGWIKKLNPKMSEGEFKELMEFSEELKDKTQKLSYFPHLLEAVDQKDDKARLMKSRVDDLAIKLSEKLRIISHWLKGKEIKKIRKLDNANAKRLFKSIPDLEYVLNYSREAGKYTLNLKEEEIIFNKDINGINSLVDLRRLIETELKFEFKVKGRKTKTIDNLSELMKYVHSSNPKEREAAYKGLLKKLEDNLDKFFLVYQSVVKDWAFEAKMRGYPSPLGMRNFANHISDQTVDNLLTSCRENRGIFQDYFQLKAKALGTEKLKRYDLYAPIKSKNKKIEFEEAKSLVLETLNEFSGEFGKSAEKIIKEDHVDVYPDKNKRSGAFCATVSPKITPYVLLNFTKQERDVATLAHELGHGIHSLLASHHYPSAQHADLPLAETASTLCETIVFEKMYQKEKDNEVKKSMLWSKVADSYATVLRQNYFVVFEKRAHEQIKTGLTKNELSELWLESLKEQFGERVDIDPLFKYEWAYIPHIVESPFYCYAYNFGELLSLSLLSRYKENKKTFLPKIEHILKSGGSKEPSQILKEVGININDKGFWQGGFEVIKEWIKEIKNF